MRIATSVLASLISLQGVAYAAKGPEIKVVDGKISMSAEAVPLGRLITLLDRATGMTSEVKSEFANRNVSVQFNDLEFNDAVRKIFQGQPFNYVVIAGKGIRVTELAQAGAATPSSSSFPDSQPISNLSGPIQPLPIQAQPQVQNPPQPTPNVQPATINTIFGPQPNPNAGQPIPSTVPLNVPGQIAPPLGSTPLGSPVGGALGGAPVGGSPTNPAAPTPAPGQLPAPGTLGGATPGTISR